MNFSDCMLDLETLGKGPDAVIVAIGAVAFSTNAAPLTDYYNQNGHESYDDIINMPMRLFYREINIESALKFGLRIDGSTLEWWFQQSEEARKIFKNQQHLTTLESALQDFCTWRAVNVGNGDMRLWGNGATFDNVIFENAFRACGIKFPFIYQDHMCYRTMKRLGLVSHFDYRGTAHNALDDAINQAIYLQHIYKKFKELKTIAGFQA